MKLPELSEHARETLKFAARNILSGRVTIDSRVPLTVMPTNSERAALYISGYVIGPNLEVWSVCGGGLKECVHGLPCRYRECGGELSERCTVIPWPACGLGGDGRCFPDEGGCKNCPFVVRAKTADERACESEDW